MFFDIRAVTAKIDNKTDLTNQIYSRFTYLEPTFRNISIKFSQLLAVLKCQFDAKNKTLCKLRANVRTGFAQVESPYGRKQLLTAVSTQVF